MTITHRLALVVGSAALACLAACSSSAPEQLASLKSPAPKETASLATETPVTDLRLEAIRPLGGQGIVLAGRPKHLQELQVWLCSDGLRRMSTCRNVSPAGLSNAEYVDDIVVGWREALWILTFNVTKQVAVVRVSRDGGRTWSRHSAPARGMAAGSSSTLQVLTDRQALLTTYWANGPLAHRYRTDDGGATWNSLGDVDLGPK